MNRPHANEKPSRREMLAQQGPFQVEACGCCVLHLTFGFLTIRIAPGALDLLCGALLRAAERIEHTAAPLQ